MNFPLDGIIKQIGIHNYNTNYHATFESYEETVPCLVLDVSLSKLEKDNLKLKVEMIDYLFLF